MKNKNSGFTLVELMACIVITGILGLVFIPGFAMVHKQDVRKAAELICLDLTMMKRQSISTGYEYKFKINDTENKYTLHQDVMGDNEEIHTSYQDDINPNIKYEMYKVIAELETAVKLPITELHYKSGIIFDSLGNQIDKLIVNITYEGDERMVAEIIYDGLTGYYKIVY